MSVLKIKNELGEWQSIPTIQGPKGDTGNAGPQGPTGADGEDAKINGYNTVNIVAGENITLEQENNNLRISATGGTEVDYFEILDGELNIVYEEEE